MKKVNKFEDFLNESVRDKMEGKSKDELTKLFKDKYGVEYVDIEETIKLLNENGVESKIVGNPYEPIEITGWSITRRNRSGQGWGLGNCISKEVADNVSNMLSENRDSFWTNNETFEVKKENFRSWSVSHENALKILSKVKKL